jgi:GNAT superfamily N-acetyltransferase
MVLFYDAKRLTQNASSTNCVRLPFMLVDVTTTSLEMLSPTEFKPSTRDIANLEVVRAEIPLPELNRFLYTAIGGDYFWIDRLPWTYAKWEIYLERPELETWLAYLNGTVAGYFELERQVDNVEISIFGLIPKFVGLGIGGVLLSKCIARAWELKPTRVWVHTCSLDGAQALANYQARGFKVFHQETSTKNLPEQSPGAWLGAQRAKV